MASKIIVDQVQKSGGTAFTLPSADGTPNQLMKTDGSGQLGWATDSGKVLQMVYVYTGAYATGSTTMPFDDTIPQNTEGNEVMTLAITPTSASSKLLINVDVWGSSDVQGNWTAALFRDSTADALTATQVKASNLSPDQNDHCHLSWVADSSSTSATTFKVRCGQHNAGSWYFNGENGSRLFGGVANSGITIMEVSA